MKRRAHAQRPDLTPYPLFQVKIKEQVGMRANDRKARDMGDNRYYSVVVHRCPSSELFVSSDRRDMGVLNTIDDKTDRLAKKIGKSYLHCDIDVAGIETTAVRQIRREQRERDKEREQVRKAS